MLPAGTYKVRSNDTDYRFRPDTAHTYFSGNQTSDAVLVIEDGESVLYARPRSARDTDEFFRDRQYGELWAGRRPSLNEMSASLGLEVRHIDELARRSPAAARPACTAASTRASTGWSPPTSRDEDLARSLSEMRLIKDDWEVGELQEACDITALGFEDSVREWDRVLEYGERWIEGTFFRRARAMGNDIGYDSIVGGGTHATTLHWIDNTGPITPGELVLLDMGVEGHNLYTADVTRTLPVDGTFTGAAARPLRPRVRRAGGRHRGGEARRAVPAAHNAAMDVLAHGLDDLGLLPVSVEEALDPGQQGLLALDAARHQPHARHGRARLRLARRGLRQGHLAEGMVLTVEPGLYFQEDDLLVPEELRGIGIRIEDDILVTADGYRTNFQSPLPSPPPNTTKELSPPSPHHHSSPHLLHFLITALVVPERGVVVSLLSPAYTRGRARPTSPHPPNTTSTITPPQHRRT